MGIDATSRCLIGVVRSPGGPGRSRRSVKRPHLFTCSLGAERTGRSGRQAGAAERAPRGLCLQRGPRQGGVRGEGCCTNSREQTEGRGEGGLPPWPCTEKTPHGPSWNLVTAAQETPKTQGQDVIAFTGPACATRDWTTALGERGGDGLVHGSTMPGTQRVWWTLRAVASLGS